MNTNEKEWPDFWDQEADDDNDDDYNDLGSDVDANNDETFHNAAEWNEDEHEELIARDSILSHTISGWSPFGGKDLFNSPDGHLQTPTLRDEITPRQTPRAQCSNYEAEQQRLIRQHHIRQQGQQHLHLIHQKQMQSALLKRQPPQAEIFMPRAPQCFTVEELERQMQLDLLKRKQPKDEVVVPKAPQCFTVEELERQIINDRSESKHNPTQIKEDNNQNKNDRSNRSNKYELHGSGWRDDESRRERVNRFENENKHGQESRNNRRMNRIIKNHRDNTRPQFTIVPPQVQLTVIERANRKHNLLTHKHPNEFLQDRLGDSKDGLLFRKPGIASARDGVLSDNERSWLIRIQGKIQADYDDNLDQDYYYLLYFNRSSMTDEAASKPCGPGVLDRRFVPRERLLYNSSA